MRKQAEMMEARMKAGGVKKKTPLIKKEVISFENPHWNNIFLFDTH